jgi:hypothetical protein
MSSNDLRVLDATNVKGRFTAEVAVVAFSGRADRHERWLDCAGLGRLGAWLGIYPSLVAHGK